MKITAIDFKIYSYTAIIIFLHVLYIMAFVGIGNISKEFIQKISTIVQIAIGIFLFIKFFPFREYKLEPGDGAIIFGCSTFILTNVGITSIVMNLIEKGGINKFRNFMNSAHENRNFAESD